MLKSDGDVSPLKYSAIPRNECIVIIYLGRILSWLMTLHMENKVSKPCQPRHFIFHECHVALSLTYTESFKYMPFSFPGTFRHKSVIPHLSK